MANGIEISKNTVNDILDTLLDKNEELSEKEFQEIFAQVRTFAMNFKQSAQNIEQRLIDFEQNLGAVRDWWARISADYTSNKDKRANLPDEFAEYKRRRKAVRDKYLNAEIRAELEQVYHKGFMLQDILNAFIGQKVETVIVWVGKKGIPETYILNELPKLYLDLDSKTGKAVERYKTSVTPLRKSLQSLESQFLQQEVNDVNFHFQELQNAYQKIKNRYDTYKCAGGSYVVWLNPNKHPKWNGAFVSSFGSVNEAYASAFLRKDYNPSGIPEDDIEILMQGVLSVTNLAGALEGDVTVGNVEYAIKSKGASTLSLKQLLSLADEIITKDFSYKGLREMLKNIKEEQRKKAGYINKAIEVNLESEVDSEVKAFIKSINKT